MGGREMSHSFDAAGTILCGRGMLAQLSIEIRQQGAFRPAVICMPEDRRKARKAARMLVPGLFPEIPVISDASIIRSGPEADFFILAGSPDLADMLPALQPESGATGGRPPAALVPLNLSQLEDLDGPVSEFLVLDSVFISSGGERLAAFFRRYAESISGGAAFLPFNPRIPRAFSYACRTRVVSGSGSLSELPGMLREAGVNHPLVLSDKGLSSIGLVARLEEVLKGTDIQVFDDIPPDSDSKVVDRIVRMYRSGGRDGIVAFGGGSVLDTGKGVFLGVSTPGAALTDWAGSGRIPRLSTPFFAVPTTSGTGSEVTKAAVVADAEQGRKVLYISSNLQPDAAILDGSLSTGLPPFLTSITGMDALSHAVEAYTCLGKNPLSDQMAWGAIERICDNLIPLMDDPQNEIRRDEMALASSMAGQAFSNSMVGMVHTIGHSVGGVCHAPHGSCMSVLLPVSLEYNRALIAPLLAELLPALTGEPIPEGLSADDAATLFISRVREMNRILKEKTGGRHPESLRDMKDREGNPLVTKEHFEDIARTAMGDGSIVYNPRELRYQDILDVLEKVY